jgi:branched-chain amino acid transport system ATP-binding protein
LAADPFIVSLERVTAGYLAEVDVLSDLTLRVRAGTVTSIIGANGAGKSTVLRAIYGFARVRGGRINLRGDDITNRPPSDMLALGVAYVAQGRCNFPEMTVRENLAVACYTRRDRERRRDTEDVLDRFPMLRSKSADMAGNLSGGQQQILEMAMALVMRPRLLLIDEPTLGLSPKFFEEVFRNITQIHGDGVTVLMVEQNAARALAISDVGVVLELGRVIKEDAGSAILADPSVRDRYLGGRADH